MAKKSRRHFWKATTLRNPKLCAVFSVALSIQRLFSTNAKPNHLFFIALKWLKMTKFGELIRYITFLKYSSSFLPPGYISEVKLFR